MNDTTTPQAELTCDTASRKTADGVPCVPVCSTATRKYADSVPCEPVCSATTLKYADGVPCEHADIVTAVDQVTSTTSDQTTTTTIVVLGRAGSLPVTGVSMDGFLLGLGVMLAGAITLIFGRRPISR